MARETQKAKIERLEKENAELKSLLIKCDEQIKKLQAENKRLKTKRKIKADENNLELIDQQLQKAQNNSDRWHSEFFKEQQKNKELENEIQKLKDENENLKSKKAEPKKIFNERGAGRKNKFNEQEIETIKVMRLRGDKLKDIAEQCNCSVGLVHKLIHEEEKYKGGRK